MQVCSFDDIIKEPIVVALGFFDCVHVAHRRLIDKAVTLAKEKDARCAVLTFDNNPRTVLEKTSKSKLIYDFSTRCEIFGELNVDMVIKTTFDDRFAALTEQEFLAKLFKNNLVGVVCGFDYTFGSNKKGSVKELKDYCNTNGVDCIVFERQDFDGEKISTRYINGLLTDGKIEEANLLLGDRYRYSGVVVHGHEIGRTIGFRTVNLVADENVVLVKNGVYYGFVEVDGKKYKAIVNVGRRPTFNDDNTNIEAHLLNFNGDVYGRRITVFFEKFMRAQKHFDSVEELKLQLKKDKETAAIL